MATRFGIGVELGAAIGLVIGAMLGNAGLGLIFGAAIGSAFPAAGEGGSGWTAALTMHDDPAVTAAQIDYGGV